MAKTKINVNIKIGNQRITGKEIGRTAVKIARDIAKDDKVEMLYMLIDAADEIKGEALKLIGNPRELLGGEDNGKK